MKTIALIPARIESARFPGKLLKPLAESTVIGCTYSNVLQSHLFDEAAVVTDSDEIAEHILSMGGQVLRNKKPHQSGTDRIAEFSSNYSEEDIIINVQGDEPFIGHEVLKLLIELMKEKKETCKVGTLMHRITAEEDIRNPNIVKVVSSDDGRALFFSRSPIPYNRDNSLSAAYFKHIGIYAFTRQSLERFTGGRMSSLEKIEKLENLRFLELSIPVFIRETLSVTMGIDTEEDWERAQAYAEHLKKY